MNYLTEPELRSLTTRRLLAYKNKHFVVPYNKMEGTTEDFTQWELTRNLILAILSERPHVERTRYVKSRV